MNKQEIIKYLAEKMGWVVDPEEGDYTLIDGSFTGMFWDELQCEMKNGVMFDPFNDIRHAFMVQDAIAGMGEETMVAYGRKLNSDIAGMFTHYFLDIFRLAAATPEQRTLAAFKALAPAELQKELL